MAALNGADGQRRNDYAGRGNLSNEALVGAVRLNFPTHVAGHLLPDLYPAQTA
jgi:hypothetical protein